jgi:enolase-phosphatase E1
MCYDLWSQSYDNGTLKTHVYDEVPDVFNYWRFEEFVKIYSYASGPAEGQRQFLKASVKGDLNRYIANGLNASGGYKFDADKFRSVASALRESKLDNLMYITDSPKKARNAITAGLRSIVVNRTGKNEGKHSPQETQGLTVIENLSDIELVDNPNASPHCC